MNINRATNGFVKVYYSINDSDLAEDNNAFVVFLRMVRFAHHEDDFTSIRFRGKQYHLKRGEFSASVKELAELVNLPVGTLRDVLERLESAKRISKQTDNRTTVFRICNYSKYQDNPAKSPANKPTIDPANDPASPTEGKKSIKNIKSIDTKVSNTMALERAKTPSSDINEMFNIWHQVTGLKIEGQLQKNRFACSNLLKKYGKDGLTQLIGGVKFAQETPYAPKIADFVELQAKQNKLMQWGKSAKTQFQKKGLVIV